jgi:hypothetical protein
LVDVKTRESRQSNMARSQLSTISDVPCSAYDGWLAVDSRTIRRVQCAASRPSPHPCFRKNFCPRGVLEHEANLSAQQPASQTHPWIPRTHGYRRRPKSSREPTRKGSRAPYALTGLVLARRCSPTRQGSLPSNDCIRRRSSDACSPSPRARAIVFSPCLGAPAGAPSLDSV